jgi:hypothetical protein
MYNCSFGAYCRGLLLKEYGICSSVGVIRRHDGCAKFGEYEWWYPVVVKEVSVDDVDYTSSVGSSCVFW